MNNRPRPLFVNLLIRSIPLWIAVAAAVTLLHLRGADPVAIEPRLPGTDLAPDASEAAGPVRITGTLETDTGQPADIAGAWPGFRGPGRDGRTDDPTITLIEDWPADGPKTLWTLDAGEGYAGAAVANGRVYLMDYDRDRQMDVIRCLSLDTGADIWRYTYPVQIKRNHGMSRTVPAVTDDVVVTIGPKCHVTCLDAGTGQFKWMINLPAEYGTTVPPWYAGQCPLIDNGAVILAPAGDETMMIAVDVQTGELRWQTPNSPGWAMTHSSIMKAEFFGRPMYLYCAGGGIIGVSADDGRLLWQSDAWKIRIANIPSPVIVDAQRLFLSGGYNRGSLMMQLNQPAGEPQTFQPEVLFSLAPAVFGSDQQTPVFYQGHIYGVRPDGRLVCLDLQGNIRWTSNPQNKFGLGPYIIVNDLIYVMDDDGLLSMVRAQSSQFELLDQAQVLHGHDAWGPMAYVAGRLIVRDLTTIKCIEIGN